MKMIIDGNTVGYTDQGQGTPLVFLHAFPLSKAMWHHQVDAFTSSHRVITIDFPGHGESDTVLWHDTLDHYADHVLHLLDKLEISQAIFIGLSMGGYVLFSIYRRYPDRVQAMILADTRAQSDNEEGKTGRSDMAQLAFSDGASAIAEMMLPKLLAPSTITHHPTIVAQIRQMILPVPTAGIVVDLVAMAARADSTDLLHTISCPTLLIVGEEDQATPVAESEYMAQHIPEATMITIPHAGHLSNFEQPAAFNQALRPFLENIA